MTFGYGLRLALLAPASFFAAHLVFAILVRAAAGPLIRRARRLSTADAANFLLCARLMPSVLALAVIAGLCVPSFVLHEQRTAAEGIGAACLIASVLGIAAWGDGLRRGARAVLASSRVLRHADHARGLVALAGIFRPRLLVSRDVIEALPSEELNAALSHERAHWTSRDNLKSLVVLLMPGILPGMRGFEPLERAWRQFSEWAADDRATAGDPQSGVALAAVLIHVSRLAAQRTPVPLAASLLDTREHLEARVTRLLSGAAMAQPRQSRLPIFIMTAAFLAAALPLLRPGAFLVIHDLIEKLIR